MSIFAATITTTYINEAHMEDAPLRFTSQDVLYLQPLSLD